VIKDILKIHDKYSIEIKQSYYSVFKKKASDYRVLTYLFIPSALNINEQTYSKDQFYKDIRVNIRYNTPEYTLVDLISKEKSPLNKLIRAIQLLPKKPNNIQLRNVEILGKIFATVFSSAIRNNNREIRKQCKQDCDELVKDYVEQIEEILKVYRLYLKNLDKHYIDIHQKITLHFGDEFISNAIEHQILVLHKYISKKKMSSDLSFDLLLKLLKQEQEYKKKKYYDNVSIEDLNQEYIIHKRSQLKKYIDSIFFLNKNIRKDGALAEQSIFAFAAGFAMLFSTGIAFYYQQKYGNFTSAFFITLVISYMLKDRIKGMISKLFISKAHIFYYDYKIAILNANKHKVGMIKENFSFVPFKKLGPKIKKIRFSERTLNVEDDLFGEHIIQYKKKIVLFPKKLGNEIAAEKLNSIVDITRINLFRYTQNMDNPKKSYYFVKENEIVKSEADRVYHINIVQKFYTEEGIEFKRYRVVINRNGIKRIEKVNIIDFYNLTSDK